MANTNAVMATDENDRSDWSRYQIRIITENDCKTLGAVVAASASKREAKEKASTLGGNYYYGVAIVDIEDGIVDAGECDGDPLVFDLDEIRIVA